MNPAVLAIIAYRPPPLYEIITHTVLNTYGICKYTASVIWLQNPVYTQKSEPNPDLNPSLT